MNVSQDQLKKNCNLFIFETTGVCCMWTNLKRNKFLIVIVDDAKICNKDLV